MKMLSCSLLTLFACAAPALATVVVSSPSNGDTLGSAVQFVASASTSTCPHGVSAMGVYVDDVLTFVANGATLSTTLNLPAGQHRAVVQSWDFCGGASLSPVSVTVKGDSGVSVTSPANGSTVSSPAVFAATATTSCPRGVAGMGVYVNDQLVYATPGSKLNAQLPVNAGSQKTVVQEWDMCGGSSSTTVNISVGGTTLSNLQASGGWNQWGELPPVYDICSDSCGSGVTWSMNQHVSSNSLSGNATQFNIGGSTPYSDVLWSNPIIGQGSTQNLPDNGHTLLPTLHNFTYDTDVFVTNFGITQDLEFDANMYMNGVGMEWGTECNHLADGEWDIWNNVEARWVATGVPCSLKDNAWNHITLQFQRQPNNDLLYQTITVNGVTYPINQTVAPFSVPSGWWGMTVNYQMDGNYRQAQNTTYLDRLNFTYW